MMFSSSPFFYSASTVEYLRQIAKARAEQAAITEREQYELHRAMGEKALKSILKTNHHCINCGAPYEPVCSYCGSKS